MASVLRNMAKALALVLLIVFLFSCGSYNRQINNYYGQVVNNDYLRAYTSIDHIKKLQANRNRLLYLLEKGKIAHLILQYDSSNRYFNEADLFMEDARTSIKDFALGTLLNPMMRTYKGEDFEKFMVHYYKTLNYLSLNETNEALVEARRISLQSYSQQQKKGYSDDAFSVMLQGIIYEQSGDINNAFIAYRNAAEIFIKNDNFYYGVSLPDQLKKDVVRTAQLNNFWDEADRYKKLFNLNNENQPGAEGGELVLFWENGLAPVKQEANFFFSLNKDGAGNFVFTDPEGTWHIPFYGNTDTVSNKLHVDDFRSLRVAFPIYKEQPLYYKNAVIHLNDIQYSFETAQNINTLAVTTLKQRFLKEMSIALSRLVIKKLAEEAARPKQDDKNKNEKEAVSFALQLFNVVSEKVDTRNWQSLPHTISYTRIPLQKGANHIKLVLGQHDQGFKTLEIRVESNGGLQIKNVCTLK